MMKFEEHQDNRNIQITFDDTARRPTDSTKYVRNLPTEMAIQVKYLEKENDGDHCGKAIRLDNEVMHLLKAAPAMLDALRAVRTFCGFVGGRTGRPIWWTDDVAWIEWVEAHEKVESAFAQASKTTY